MADMGDHLYEALLMTEHLRDCLAKSKARSGLGAGRRREGPPGSSSSKRTDKDRPGCKKVGEERHDYAAAFGCPVRRQAATPSLAAERSFLTRPASSVWPCTRRAVVGIPPDFRPSRSPTHTRDCIIEDVWGELLKVVIRAKTVQSRYKTRACHTIPNTPRRRHWCSYRTASDSEKHVGLPPTPQRHGTAHSPTAVWGVSFAPLRNAHVVRLRKHHYQAQACDPPFNVLLLPGGGINRRAAEIT
ncbi:hypothetical protein BJV78DRAFT_1303779 [Lactifluus subvellereus]|nr:hypothetical protein BJV78DRAFT_1303779 [Lactifluus subvellereus]